MNYDYTKRPFLVDLNCQNGLNLQRLQTWDAENHQMYYSSLVGFQFKPTRDVPFRPGMQLFYHTARFTQCRHIPWVIYHPTSWTEAEEAVRLHGHAGSRVHPLTGECRPPVMVWSTTITTRPARNNIYPTFYRLRGRNMQEI